MKPHETLPQRMAEVVCEGFAPDIRHSLGENLETFLNEQDVDEDR